ncbi:MAG: PAS domain S-box protein, partial [Chloroflexota bacterium]|nr:PAS domain S-box protein [Chloroflexota bacterium]
MYDGTGRAGEMISSQADDDPRSGTVSPDSVLIPAELILEQVHDAVITVAPDGHILGWNRAAEAMYGWSASEVLGRPLDDVIPVVRYLDGQDRAAVQADFRRNAFWQGTFVQRHRDGRELIVDGSSRLIRDEQSSPRGVVSINRDITGRVSAEDALRASEERFRSTYAAVGQATISPDGRFLQVNRAFCELTGYSEAELLAMTMPAITVPEDVEANLEYDRRLLAGEISHFHMEKHYRRKDGGIVTVLLSAAAVHDAEGQPRYIIGVVQDITKRKQMEQALQRANEELEQRVQARTAELHAANERLRRELR